MWSGDGIDAYRIASLRGSLPPALDRGGLAAAALAEKDLMIVEGVKAASGLS